MTELHDKLEETLIAVGKSPQYLDDPVVMDDYATACWTLYEIGDKDSFFYYVSRYQNLRAQQYFEKVTRHIDYTDEEGKE